MPCHVNGSIFVVRFRRIRMQCRILYHSQKTMQTLRVKIDLECWFNDPCWILVLSVDKKDFSNSSGSWSEVDFGPKCYCPSRIFLRSGLAVQDISLGSPYPKKHLRWTQTPNQTNLKRRFNKVSRDLGILAYLHSFV